MAEILEVLKNFFNAFIRGFILQADISIGREINLNSRNSVYNSHKVMDGIEKTYVCEGQVRDLLSDISNDKIGIREENRFK